MREQRALNQTLTDLLTKSAALIEKLKVSEHKADPETFVNVSEAETQESNVVLANGIVVQSDYIDA